MTRTLRHLYLPNSSEPVGLQADDFVFANGLIPGSRISEVTLDGVRSQTRELLACMQSLLIECGGSIANIGRATCYLRNAGEQREALYDVWDELFPDPNDKPAFKILDAPLLDGVLVKLDFEALIGHTRTRIDIPNVDARDPAVRIGHCLFTSRLHGTSPETGDTVDGLEAQARQALHNGVRLVELAGGSRGDIKEICGFGRDLSYVPTLQRLIEQEFRGAPPAFKHIVTFVRPILEVMVEVTARLPD